MLQIIKALVVLIILASITFKLLKELTRGHLAPELFHTLKRGWYQITIAAFLSFNFWLFSFFTVVSTYFLKKKLKNPVALFTFLLFIIPIAGAPIYGFGGINYFFILDFATLITFLIVYPSILSLNKLKKYRAQRQKMLLPEKIFYIFLLLKVLVEFKTNSFTGAFRTLFILVFNIYLPFYLFCNFAISKQWLKEVVIAFIMVVVLLSMIAIFEATRYWPLYSILNRSLNLYNGVEFIVARDGLLRAIATTQQPIVLGYTVSVGLGLYWAVKAQYFNSGLASKVTGLVLVLGLVSPFSRGPWVGALLMLLVYVFLNRNTATNITKIILVLMLSLVLASFTKYGEKVINMLPIVGHTEIENIDYRAQLITNSLIVASRNPWFGSANFLAQPEMEELRQGQGIIDITNIYLQVLLSCGYVGLFLFVTIFVTTLIGLYRAIKLAEDEEMRSLAKGLFATLVGVMFIIGDVSSISFVPWVYWIMIGLSISTIKLIRHKSLTSDVLNPINLKRS